VTAQTQQARVCESHVDQVLCSAEQLHGCLLAGDAPRTAYARLSEGHIWCCSGLLCCRRAVVRGQLRSAAHAGVAQCSCVCCFCCATAEATVALSVHTGQLIGDYRHYPSTCGCVTSSLRRLLFNITHVLSPPGQTARQAGVRPVLWPVVAHEAHHRPHQVASTMPACHQRCQSSQLPQRQAPPPGGSCGVVAGCSARAWPLPHA
jgi:hypothetical protein